MRLETELRSITKVYITAYCTKIKIHVDLLTNMDLETKVLDYLATIIHHQHP